MSNPEWGKGGYHPARRLELSVGTRGSGHNTATDHEKAVKFAQRARANGRKGFREPTSDRALVDTSRIPSAARRGARSISGFQAAVDRCTALDAGELGLRVR
jgi:hypothetical protein